MNICPGADPTDGRFDVLLISAVSRRSFVASFPTVYAGRHLSRPECEMLHARTVEVRGDAALLDVDGEGPGATPGRFTVLPGALVVRAPVPTAPGTGPV